MVLARRRRCPLRRSSARFSPAPKVPRKKPTPLLPVEGVAPAGVVAELMATPDVAAPYRTDETPQPLRDVQARAVLVMPGPAVQADHGLLLADGRKRGIATARGKRIPARAGSSYGSRGARGRRGSPSSDAAPGTPGESFRIHPPIPRPIGQDGRPGNTAPQPNVLKLESSVSVRVVQKTGYAVRQRRPRPALDR